MIKTSPLLSSIRGLRHGFSTRRGGVSDGPYATLNLDRGVGDDETRVRENRARFLEGLGLDAGTRLVQIVQVHGTEVLDAREAEGKSGDGLYSTTAELTVGVRTADCLPVLIAGVDATGRAEVVSAVHAGWRGATAGIVKIAIAKLETLGARRERMRFALGPAIGLEAFEVGEEVIEAAQRSLDGRPPPMMRKASGRPHLDLRGLVREQLLDLGICAETIETVGGCTHAEPDLYYSHRRDQGHTGRHVSAIGLTD